MEKHNYAISIVLFIVAGSAMGLPDYDHNKESPFKNCYKNYQSTADLRKCLDKDYQHFDGQLNSNYKILMSQLPKFSQPKLKAAENAWVAFKDKECDLNAYNQKHPGTMASLIYASCQIGFTKQRAAEIKTYINNLKKYGDINH